MITFIVTIIFLAIQINNYLKMMMSDKHRLEVFESKIIGILVSAIVFIVVLVYFLIIVIVLVYILILEGEGIDFILIWTVPIAFMAFIIGLIGTRRLQKHMIKWYGQKQVYFKRSREFFLLNGAVIIFLPLIAIFYNPFIYFDSYSSRMVIIITWYLFSIFIFTFFMSFSSRKLNERIYNKNKFKTGSLKKDIIKDKKGLGLFAIYLVIILVLTIQILDYGPYYDKHINRKYSNQVEKEAISISEGFDYGTYLNLPLFHKEEIAVDDTPDYDDFVLINFINTTSIKFFSEKIDHLEKEKIKVEAYYYYSARVFFKGDIDVVYNETPRFYDFDEPYSRYGSGLRVFSDENIILNQQMHPDYIFAENLSSLYRDNDSDTIIRLDSFQYFFNDVYVIIMELSYWEYFEPPSGFDNYIGQLIVLDDELNVKLVLIEIRSQSIHEN